jgi:hypothetical protein
MKVCTGTIVEMFARTRKEKVDEILAEIRFKERRVEVIFAVTRKKEVDEVLVGIGFGEEETEVIFAVTEKEG